MSIGILGTIIIIAVVFIVALISVSIDQKQMTNDWKERARQIEKLKPASYTEKQLKRMEAIESIYNENRNYFQIGKLAIEDKEFLGFTYQFEGMWLAIFEDEVLPSKACSAEFHIYPVARKDFTKYYTINMDIKQKKHSEGKFETVAPNASVTKRAVAGAVIGGGVGAVIGAASAIDKNSRGPKTQYVIKEHTTNNYFPVIRSFIAEKGSKLQALDYHFTSVKTYIEDNKALKQLTPKTGKEIERKIKLSENNWINKRIWEGGYINHNFSQEAAFEQMKAIQYLLNEY